MWLVAIGRIALDNIWTVVTKEGIFFFSRILELIYWTMKWKGHDQKWSLSKSIAALFLLTVPCISTVFDTTSLRAPIVT